MSALLDRSSDPTTVEIPRPEYPRPQLVRERWLNLNGRWDFEIDAGDSGWERGLVSAPLGRQITVPFAPESELSGIEHVDFMAAVWYRRSVEVPADWAGSRVLLHFGAVDHDTTAWIGETEVGRHRGGFSSFTFDITDAITPGETATLTVRARDLPGEIQARGKQAIEYANHACNYTRTTGIWQTVWLEPVPPSSVKRLKITPNANTQFLINPELTGAQSGQAVNVTLSDEAGVVATATAALGIDVSPQLVLDVPAERRRVWSTSDPHLYQLSVNLTDANGSVIDQVQSYAGLRSVSVVGHQILINGEPVFQRLVLDQGYWPQSLMTPPSDQAMIDDIELSLAAGFNGARLHQKVFEERFYYHADRLGYLVWAEFGDWGCEMGGPVGRNQQPTANYVAQWLEILQRDHSHPSIVGWCPLNETWEVRHDRMTVLDDVTRAMFLATKLADPSRPVLDASGYSHRIPETDVWDSHNYEQDPVEFARQLAGLKQGLPYANDRDGKQISLPYAGQPYFVSEYGGIWWKAELAGEEKAGVDQSTSWGYGQRVGSEEEFYQRFEGLTNVLLDDPLQFGYCYTQLTDVFQEDNGLYHFDRSQKFDIKRIRAVQQRPAAYEKSNPTPPVQNEQEGTKQ